MLELEEGSYISKLIIKNAHTNKIGLCVGWDEVNLYKNLDVDIIGSLYTLNGAQIMLRNIFLNPKIKVLIIVDKNKLGQEPMGKHGLNFMFNVFFKEQFELVKEYMCKDLSKNLMIYYVSNNGIEYKYNKFKTSTRCNTDNILNVINNIIDDLDSDELDKITRIKLMYKPPPHTNISQIPNEYLGCTLYGTSLFDAWYMALKHVYTYGFLNHDNLLEYHSLHWSFPVPNLEILDDDLDKYRKIINQDIIQQYIGIAQPDITTYVSTITTNILPDNSAYTYGNRLEPFKQNIIDALTTVKNTRHAFATTIKYDEFDKQPPCLVYLQLLFDQYNNTLNMYVTFRSHDIFRGALPNAYALARLLLLYSKIVDISPGKIEITSISAHVYKECMENTKLLLECLAPHMNDILRLDQRGNCIISQDKDDDMILELLSSKNNELIHKIKGSPKYIFQKILDDKIIIDTQHLSYIFKQLFG